MRISSIAIRFILASVLYTIAGCNGPVEESLRGIVDTEVIPLNRIWAYEMPDTQDIRELEPDVYGSVVLTLPADERDRRFNESLIAQILAKLGPASVTEPGPIKLSDPRAAFAVKGKDLDALHEAHAILVRDKRSAASFRAGEDITLVFFSYQAGSFVHLRDVKRRGTEIQIRYQFVPHVLATVTSHFALIHLGKLPQGTYQVDFVQAPMDGHLSRGSNAINENWEKQIICKSFSFSVIE